MAPGSHTQTISPHPLSVAEVLRATLRVSWRGLVPIAILIGISAVTEALVSSGYDLIAASDLSASETGLPRGDRATLLLWRLLALVAYFGYSVVGEALFGGVAIVLASNTMLGRNADLLGACRQTVRRIGPLVAVIGVTWLVIPLLFITILGIPFAIYVGLGWLLAPQIVVLERSGWRDALRRSKEMIRWHRWHLLACYLIVSLLQLALYNIPSCLLAGGVGGGSWLQGCPAPEDAALLLQLGDTVIRGLAGALVQALVYVTITLLYYDFRVGDERLDLDLRAAVLDRPATR